MIEGTLLDITERKNLEEQLRQAQRIEAVGRLAGGVAHDFNNLLTAILGYSDIVLEQLPSGDRLRHYVGEIKKAGERAASLTRQLLAFSRQQVLAPLVLDLNAVVADMEKMLRRLIGEDIELVTVLGHDLARVKADPSQLEQVIMNLAVNARDAMPEGGRLSLATANFLVDEAYAQRHVGLKPGPYVTLTVTDTGCGMDAETLSRIFEPFFTTKEKGKGTGLGLSTVYGVVKQSGGYIEVESEPGRGTAFRVYLPQVEESLTNVKEREPAAAPSSGAETILLVEDEESVRTLVESVLRSKGYKVIPAARGDEALALSEQYAQPIALMLVDMVMPRMSGRELARRLAPLHPETKVLFMSGYAGSSASDGLDADTHFIQKPFTSEALARKVRETLDA
jgi:two-component system cell cycle sensor histidine kinase/response regulator CckA